MARVMGILNVTPDSFSDGGQWLDPAAAIAHGLGMLAEGADLIDVGGESTRPGAHPVDEEEELRRILPVIGPLAAHTTVSVDTRKASVARAAVAEGASVINDVSAELWPLAAELGCGWIAMHMPADPSIMQQHALYNDVVSEVRDFLVTRAEQAALAGVDPIWIDPGIGFAKTARHNMSLLRHLEELVATGWHVLVGTSRKSFLGSLGAVAADRGRPPADRLEGSVATAVWALMHGVDMVRVHDVGPVVMARELAGLGGQARIAEVAVEG